MFLFSTLTAVESQQTLYTCSLELGAVFVQRLEPGYPLAHHIYG